MKGYRAYCFHWSDVATSKSSTMLVASAPGADALLVTSAPEADALLVASAPEADALLVASAPGADALLVTSAPGADVLLVTSAPEADALLVDKAPGADALLMAKDPGHLTQGRRVPWWKGPTKKRTPKAAVIAAGSEFFLVGLVGASKRKTEFRSFGLSQRASLRARRLLVGWQNSRG